MVIKSLILVVLVSSSAFGVEMGKPKAYSNYYAQMRYPADNSAKCSWVNQRVLEVMPANQHSVLLCQGVVNCSGSISGRHEIACVGRCGDPTVCAQSGTVKRVQ